MPFVKANPEKELDKIKAENPELIDSFEKIDAEFKKKEMSINEQKQ